MGPPGLQGSGPTPSIAETIDRGSHVRSRLLAFRRTAAIGAVWALGMGVLIATGPAASGETPSVEPGLGSAYAQGYKIDPRSGGLSFGITYGLSLAGHQNTVAVGESRSVDLGVIGTTLAGEGCDGGDPTLAKEDQPQPLVVRSTDENRSQTETEDGVEKHAEANATPYAEAIATTVAAGDAAAVKVGSTTSRTISGIVDGARVAKAITDVGDVSLGGGALVLKGLHWEATYQSAPSEDTTGSFTIEGIQAAGHNIPIKDIADGLAQANAALEPLGIALQPPQVRKASGIVFVDPLRISIVPSSTRDGVTGPIIGAAAPLREQITDALIKQDCGNAAYITIADIVLGSVTGAGSLNLELGGVTATSNEIKRTNFLGGLPELPPLLPTVSDSSYDNGGTFDSGSSYSGGGVSSFDTTSGPSLAGTATDTGTTPDSVATPSNPDEVAVGDLTPVSGSRGGPLLGVGLGGLLLLAALAEGDRRKMRQAQRSVPMEVMA